MSAYDHDPRVTRCDQGYDVAEVAGATPIWRVHEFNSYQYDVIQRRRDGEGPFTLAHFSDADEAIRSLIGGPR